MLLSQALLFIGNFGGLLGFVSPDSTIVKQHVIQNANLTFRPPSGYLEYPYLVPSGPYEGKSGFLFFSSIPTYISSSECWDWDSMFMGVAMLECCGSAPYLAGSVMCSHFAASFF